MITKAIPTILLMAVPLLTAHAQTAEEVIARSLEARGGLAALQARQTVKMTARVERPQEGYRYAMTLYRKRPSFYRSVMETGDTTVIQATDGVSSWMINTMLGINEPQTMPAAQAAAFVRQADLDTSLQGLLPEGSTATFLGRIADEDGQFLRVKISHQDRSEVTNYYDASTYLVRKAYSVQQSPAGEEEVLVLLGDYREVDGVVYSFRAERRVGGRTVTVTDWISFEHNVPMDDSIFRMPQ